MFYYKTTVPTEKQQSLKHMKCIQWKAHLKKQRCKEQNLNGTRCKKYNAIGAGVCSMHLYSHYNLRVKPLNKDKNKRIVVGLFTSSAIPEQKNVSRTGELILPYQVEVLNLKQKIHRYGESTAPSCIGGPDKDELGTTFVHLLMLLCTHQTHHL